MTLCGLPEQETASIAGRPEVPARPQLIAARLGPHEPVDFFTFPITALSTGFELDVFNPHMLGTSIAEASHRLD